MMRAATRLQVVCLVAAGLDLLGEVAVAHSGRHDEVDWTPQQARQLTPQAHVGVERVEVGFRLELDEEVHVASDGIEILSDR